VIRVLVVHSVFRLFLGWARLVSSLCGAVRFLVVAGRSACESRRLRLLVPPPPPQGGAGRGGEGRCLGGVGEDMERVSLHFRGACWRVASSPCRTCCCAEGASVPPCVTIYTMCNLHVMYGRVPCSLQRWSLIPAHNPIPGVAVFGSSQTNTWCCRRVQLGEEHISFPVQQSACSLEASSVFGPRASVFRFKTNGGFPC